MSLRARFAMVRNQTPIMGPGGLIQKDWYLFLTNIFGAVTEGLPQAEEVVTVGASPFVYQAVIRGQVHIGGGTVSSIQFSRNGSTFYSTGITQGFVQMDARDLLRVTYTVAPSITFVPM